MFVEKGRERPRSGTSERLVDPPRELLEASLEDCPLGLGVGDEPVDAAAQLVLGLSEPTLELRERLGALPLEALGRL